MSKKLTLVILGIIVLLVIGAAAFVFVNLGKVTIKGTIMGIDPQGRKISVLANEINGKAQTPPQGLPVHVPDGVEIKGPNGTLSFSDLGYGALVTVTGKKNDNVFEVKKIEVESIGIGGSLNQGQMEQGMNFLRDMAKQIAHEGVLQSVNGTSIVVTVDGRDITVDTSKSMWIGDANGKKVSLSDFKPGDKILLVGGIVEGASSMQATAVRDLSLNASSTIKK